MTEQEIGDLWRKPENYMQPLSFGAALIAAERERILARCQGKTHEGCAYLAHCGSVCNKCGRVA